jgi:site-specific DNA-adenine methylase
MINHFIICYAGNKRSEYNYFAPYITYDNITNIVEPFCGSAAISFNIWKEHKDKFNYYLNDNNQQLFEIYQLLKTIPLENIFNILNYEKKKIQTKEDFQNLVNKPSHNVFEYILIIKLSSWRFGFYDPKRNTSKRPYKPNSELILFAEFIKSKNVHITNNDWKTSFDEHKDNFESIIICDPPYLQSDNKFYANPTLNIYDYIKNNDINHHQAHIYFVLEEIPEVMELFKRNLKLTTYNKTYNITKKETKHVLYSN